MIEVFARVAMDMGRVPDRASLEALPKGQILIFSARAANAIRSPIKGQNCLVHDARGVKGWGRTDTVPEDCVIVGGLSSLIGMAARVTLLVAPIAKGGKKLDLIDFYETERVPFEGGYVVRYARLL